MTERIQADYDELEAAAARFGQWAEAGGELQRRVEAAARALADGGWLGRGADAFFAEMEGEVLPALRKLGAALAQAASATREAARLIKEAEDEAAALFAYNGSGASSGVAGGAEAASVPYAGAIDGPSGGSATGARGATEGTHADARLPATPPTQMAQMIDMLNKFKQPITIVRNGDGEYIVFLKGTDGRNVIQDPGGHFRQRNNWFSALQGGGEIPGAFERQARAVISAIPPGSTIHFVGHSQGGITAHNIVDNQDFADRYRIESVSTIGASQSANMRDGVEYHRFVNSTDPVPAMDGGMILPLVSPSLLMNHPIAAREYARQIEERLTQTPVDSGHELFEAHAAENYADALRQPGSGGEVYASPRSIDFSQWQDARVITEASSTMPVQPGFEGGGWAVADSALELGVSVPLAMAGRAVEIGTSVLPGPARDWVDRYNDRFNEAVLRSVPRPSDVAGGIVDLTERARAGARSFFDLEP